MSSLREQPPSVEERVVRSPWPEPEVPDLDLVAFVLRHARRLADGPAIIDGASGRTVPIRCRPKPAGLQGSVGG
jgi:hypothetical protein